MRDYEMKLKVNDCGDRLHLLRLWCSRTLSKHDDTRTVSRRTESETGCVFAADRRSVFS